jgi:hypothetical protein
MLLLTEESLKNFMVFVQRTMDCVLKFRQHSDCVSPPFVLEGWRGSSLDVTPIMTVNQSQCQRMSLWSKDYGDSPQPWIIERRRRAKGGYPITPSAFEATITDKLELR